MKFLIVLWAAVMVFGMGLMERWEHTPGAEISAPKVLAIRDRAERSTVLVFLRPDCACTRVTLESLEDLVVRYPNVVSVDAYVLSDEAPGQWLPALVKDFPHLSFATDTARTLASSMRATTSGTVILFSREGNPLFAGGITAARGHRGANPGLKALNDWVSKSRAPLSSWPVYGCSLTDLERAS